LDKEHVPQRHVILIAFKVATQILINSANLLHIGNTVAAHRDKFVYRILPSILTDAEGLAEERAKGVVFLLSRQSL
jgi:hypothetical protein